MTINYDELKSLTQQEITAKIKAKEIAVPQGTERDDFFRFAAANTEERLKILGGAQASPPADKIDTPPEAKPATPDQDAWYQALGYGEEAEAKNGIKELQKAVSKQKELIDKANGDKGQMGRELKRLQAELETFKKSKKDDVPEVVKPKMPARPKPSDFDDGVYDDGYQKALADYDDKLAKYLDARDEYLTKATANNDVAKQMAATQDMVKDLYGQREKSAVETVWADFWEKDIPKLQSQFGIKTTVPIKEMNDAFATLKDDKSSDGDKSTAQAWLNSLPKTDHSAYAKVRKATELRYGFDSGVPETRYRTWEATFVDHGVQKEYNAITDAGLTPAEEKKLYDENINKEKTTARVPPASSMPSADPLGGQRTDGRTDVQEYSDLNAEYAIAVSRGAQAVQAFQNSDKMKRYLDMRAKLGIYIPMDLKKRASGQIQE